jgi:hypothetical protein
MVIIKGESSPRLIEYSIEMQRWDYHYSYIADPSTGDEVDEFMESLEFQGRLSKPRGRAGTLLKLMIACEKSRRNTEPIVERPVIGHLDVKSKFVDAFVRLPASHVGRLATIASAKRIKFISLFASDDRDPQCYEISPV